MNCPVCEGHGEWTCKECAEESLYSHNHKQASATDCHSCGGAGYMICHACNGSGYLEIA